MMQDVLPHNKAKHGDSFFVAAKGGRLMDFSSVKTKAVDLFNEASFVSHIKNEAEYGFGGTGLSLALCLLTAPFNWCY